MVLADTQSNNQYPVALLHQQNQSQTTEYFNPCSISATYNTPQHHSTSVPIYPSKNNKNPPIKHIMIKPHISFSLYAASKTHQSLSKPASPPLHPYKPFFRICGIYSILAASSFFSNHGINHSIHSRTLSLISRRKTAIFTSKFGFPSRREHTFLLLLFAFETKVFVFLGILL